MIKNLCILLVLSACVFAYSDNDYDGVQDSLDKCPNTPFTDIVDSFGCSSASLVYLPKFDVIAALAYSQKEQQTLQEQQTFYASLQIDYYYKEFSVYGIISRYENDWGNGLDDTIIGLSYTFAFSKDLEISPFTTLYLPTYDSGLGNEQTDVALGLVLVYNIKNFFLQGNSSYTLVNDSDTTDLKYQNTFMYQFVLGYGINEKLYIDTGYYNSLSQYRGVDALENLLVDLNYRINEEYFVLFNYSYGLSDSASNHYLCFQFGVDF